MTRSSTPVGPTGLTAWAGPIPVAELRAEDLILVSATAGLVVRCRAELQEMATCGTLRFPTHVRDGLEGAPGARLDLVHCRST